MNFKTWKKKTNKKKTPTPTKNKEKKQKKILSTVDPEIETTKIGHLEAFYSKVENF